MRQPGVVVIGLLLLLASLVPLAVAIDASADRALTSLETTLLGTLTFLLSSVGSLVVAGYWGRQQGRDQYVQLAKPALRRVVELNRSAAQISEAIRSKRDQIDKVEELEVKVAREWLDSFDRLVRQHAGQLGAATADWQELLPEEYAELVNLAELGREYDEKIGKLAQLQDEQSAEAKKTRADLLSQIEKLRRELDKRGPLSVASTPLGLIGSGIEGRPLDIAIRTDDVYHYDTDTGKFVLTRRGAGRSETLEKEADTPDGPQSSTSG